MHGSYVTRLTGSQKANGRTRGVPVSLCHGAAVVEEGGGGQVRMRKTKMEVCTRSGGACCGGACRDMTHNPMFLAMGDWADNRLLFFWPRSILDPAMSGHSESCLAVLGRAFSSFPLRTRLGPGQMLSRHVHDLCISHNICCR